MKRKTQMSHTLLLALTGLLAAAAIALAALEAALPAVPGLPPGIKLGLSNLATMFAAYLLGFGAAAAVTCCKALFALLTRGATAGLLSLAGGLVSAAGVTALIWLARRRGCFGFLGVSVAGAVLHNAAQLLVVTLLSGSPAYLYFPVLLAAGVAAGAVNAALLRALFPLLMRNPVVCAAAVRREPAAEKRPPAKEATDPQGGTTREESPHG